MLSVLDRYLLRSLLINYLIALGVMLSLYVVLDMFVNMDEFTEQGLPLTTVTANIIDYYLPNLALYFAQLSGVIALYACTATLARMRKLNEVTAVLASGVSLYRLARPVVIFAVAASALLVLATEVVIPTVAHKLARKRDDAAGARTYEVLFLRDRDGKLLSAGQFDPATTDLRSLLVLVRDGDGVVSQVIEADRATWETPSEMQPGGRWRLERGRATARVTGERQGLGPRGDRVETYPEYYESDLGPKAIQLRQAEGWIRFLSLSQLRELETAQTGDRAAIVQIRHARIVAPITSLLLVLLGLPFFLDRSPGNVVGDAGKCVAACGLCYVTAFVAQNVRSDSVSALPAWIPIFIFGTVAMVLFDRVRT